MQKGEHGSRQGTTTTKEPGLSAYSLAVLAHLVEHLPSKNCHTLRLVCRVMLDLSDQDRVATAVAQSGTRREALRMLGVDNPGPSGYRKLEAACLAYGLSIPPPRSVDDADLAEKVCRTCRRKLLIDSFAIRFTKTGRRQSRCRECHAVARRDHYENNKEKILCQVATRNRETRERNISRILEYLATHPCVDCGETDPLVLQFDHIDPATKSGGISNLVYYALWESLMAEIRKCEVRCANCHTRRTAAQFGWLRAVLAQQVGHLPSKQE